MKKQFVVTNVETLAFDNQIVTLKGPDATVLLHLHDQTEFHSHIIGEEVTISFGEPKLTVTKSPAKKTVAKKAAVKKTVIG